MFGVMAYVFPSHITCDRALLSWRYMNTCLAVGSSDRIPCFALHLCMSFAFLLNCLISNHEFSLSPFSLSPQACWWGSEGTAAWALSATTTCLAPLFVLSY